jgi:hypothetical protein
MNNTIIGNFILHQKLRTNHVFLTKAAKHNFLLKYKYPVGFLDYKSRLPVFGVLVFKISYCCANPVSIVEITGTTVRLRQLKIHV